MRNPFGSSVMVDRAVVASPSFGGVGSSFTSTLMMLLNVGGYNLDVLVVPDRSSMNAFCRSASDDSVGRNASSRSESSAVIGLLAIDVHAGVLVLPEFGEGSSKAANLVVEISFGRYDAVTSLQLESNCHLHPGGIPAFTVAFKGSYSFKEAFLQSQLKAI